VSQPRSPREPRLPQGRSARRWIQRISLGGTVFVLAAALGLGQAAPPAPSSPRLEGRSAADEARPHPRAEDTRRPGFPGLAANRAPKVEIPWNRLYPLDELYAHFERLAAAYPGWLSGEVIGHSSEGRELRVYTLGKPRGDAAPLPAMWIDGNVHGNEVQGSEAILYLCWYLLENEATNPRVAELLERARFYLCPSVNPDGRDLWFHGANSANSSRSGTQPLDSDRDGRFDEDPANDLDGDGSITQMRKYLPGEGDFRLDPSDPRRMQRVERRPGEPRGDWILLGEEGLDDDGDGRLNEDGPGGYDMNRAWPSSWAPEFVQFGAGPYPLYWPETRAVAEWIRAHGEIGAVQSFHNSGGMILRGPGAESFGEYPRGDLAVYDALGRDGEKMLPFYRYMVIWKDLYTVFGGFVNWTYEGLGIISFTNEMWTERRLSPDGRVGEDRAGELYFDDHLLFGAGFTPWRPFQHPLYGPIEVGGFQKDVGRVPPSFLLEEEHHRNALFCLRHAEELPEVELRLISAEPLAPGLYALDVEASNRHLIPTRSARATAVGAGLPDLFELSGAELTVLASGERSDRFRPERLELSEAQAPGRIVRDAGLFFERPLRWRFLISGRGAFTLRYSGEKLAPVELVGELP
jgi:hypothetical protein